jgi:signal transduction histidine kinase
MWDRYRGYILGALAVVLMQSVLITGLLVQRARRRRAENQLREHQGRLQRSYERIRDLGARLLHAQEAERSRIARELHDDISQQMALLTMDLEAMGAGGGDAGKLSTDALERARGVVKSVRDLSHQLHPARLRLIGLVSALQALCGELTQGGTEIKFAHHNVPPSLPPDLMLCLFRVAQESLQNALKYSHAREISLHLSNDATGLTLTVVDDGVGFDLESAWGRGLGLVSIGERLEAIGASLEIRTAPGAGTRLKVTVARRMVETNGAQPSTYGEREPDRELSGYAVQRGA